MKTKNALTSIFSEVSPEIKKEFLENSNFYYEEQKYLEDKLQEFYSKKEHRRITTLSIVIQGIIATIGYFNNIYIFIGFLTSFIATIVIFPPWQTHKEINDIHQAMKYRDILFNEIATIRNIIFLEKVLKSKNINIEERKYVISQIEKETQELEKFQNKIYFPEQFK